MTTRVLTQLGADGRIVRGRPRGTWSSTQHTWTPMATWLGAELPVVAPDEAQVELVRRWLRSFGPATVADLRWWTGWSAGEVKRALAAIEPVEVELDGGETGLVLADDTAPVRAPEAVGGAAARPRPDGDGLDGTGVVRRAARRRAVRPLRQHRADGVVVRAHRRRLGPAARRRGGGAAARGRRRRRRRRRWTRRRPGSRRFLGGTRMPPRFRTPLERELGATSARPDALGRRAQRRAARRDRASRRCPARWAR